MKRTGNDKGNAPAAPSRGLPQIVLVWMGFALFWVAVDPVTRTFYGEPKAAAPQAKTVALAGYVNDSAAVLSPARVAQLGTALAQFEKETSIQVAVAIYPQAPVDSIEEFTMEVADASRLGRKGLDNGAILSIFVKENAARLEVGYGLEGALTDLEAHRILDSVLAPAWKAGERERAIEATLAAITERVREEYKAGKMPGPVAFFWRQLKVELPRIVRSALPTLAALPLDARLGISFFGGLIGVGIWDGVLQAVRILRNALIAARNLRAGRAMSYGTKAVGLESIVDSIKVIGFVIGVIAVAAGIVVVAGGGAFGGAGSTLRW